MVLWVRLRSISIIGLNYHNAQEKTREINENFAAESKIGFKYTQLIMVNVIVCVRARSPFHKLNIGMGHIRLINFVLNHFVLET